MHRTAVRSMLGQVADIYPASRTPVPDPAVATVLIAVGVCSLLPPALWYALSVFEPQPNRARMRYVLRSAAVGGFVGGSVGAAIDLTLRRST